LAAVGHGPGDEYEDEGGRLMNAVARYVTLALRQLLRLVREYPREPLLATVQEAARYHGINRGAQGDSHDPHPLSVQPNH